MSSKHSMILLAPMDEHFCSIVSKKISPAKNESTFRWDLVLWSEGNHSMQRNITMMRLRHDISKKRTYTKLKVKLKSEKTNEIASVGHLIMLTII